MTRSEVVARLVAIAQLSADWSGMGNDAPNPDAIRDAMLWLWEEAGTLPDRIVPGPNGEVLLEWCRVGEPYSHREFDGINPTGEPWTESKGTSS